MKPFRQYWQELFGTGCRRTLGQKWKDALCNPIYIIAWVFVFVLFGVQIKLVFFK